MNYQEKYERLKRHIIHQKKSCELQTAQFMRQGRARDYLHASASAAVLQRAEKFIKELESSETAESEGMA